MFYGTCLGTKNFTFWLLGKCVLYCDCDSHTKKHTHTHSQKHTHTHAHTFTLTHAHMHAHTLFIIQDLYLSDVVWHFSEHKQFYFLASWEVCTLTDSHTKNYTPTHMHTHMRTQMHAHTCTHMHAHMHAYTCTHAIYSSGLLNYVQGVTLSTGSLGFL